jgi:hypothetical protein
MDNGIDGTMEQLENGTYGSMQWNKREWNDGAIYNVTFKSTEPKHET